MLTDHDTGDEHAAPAAPTAIAPEPLASWFHWTSRKMVDALACRLGGPVYLCGSALTLAHPSDVDLRMPLDEPDLRRLFGRDRGGDGWETGERAMRRMREQLKQSRRLSRVLRANIDFQIQTAAEWAAHEHRPRLRLDGVPDDVLAAGLGDP